MKTCQITPVHHRTTITGDASRYVIQTEEERAYWDAMKGSASSGYTLTLHVDWFPLNTREIRREIPCEIVPNGEPHRIRLHVDGTAPNLIFTKLTSYHR